jgi:scyllo-inositol 2-dehydrogenase (NADP+)
MKLFRWAIIGPGNIAKEFAHDLSYIKNSHHRISAVIAKDMDDAMEFAAEQNVPAYYDDINEWLKNPEADAVYIATPHTLHYAQTLQCLEHKIPVLCEKPLAINAQQVREMVEASQRNQTFLLEGMWIRFLPSMYKVLSLIEKGTIGSIVNIKADMSYRAPYEPEGRFFNPELGGGSLLDLGVYPIFLSLLLLGKPSRISASGKLSELGIDETCAALLSYEHGRYTIAESSIITQTSKDAVIYGDKGLIRIERQWNEKPSGITVESHDGTIMKYPCEWEGRGFQYEIEEVYACLDQNKIESDKITHQFSIDLIETMDEIRRQINVKYPVENMMSEV